EWVAPCGNPPSRLNSEFNLHLAWQLKLCQVGSMSLRSRFAGVCSLRSLPEKKSLMDQTYEVILEALCDGTFKPGDRLTQEEIALQLNVSRQPVTHALAILKSQGFVEPVGKRGLTVTPVDPAMFEAIYQFRSAVEPLAVALAT